MTGIQWYDAEMVSPRVGRPRLSLRWRYLPFRRVLPGLRWLAVGTLLVALVVGGWRWLHPELLGALEFTPRTVGGMDGVQGMTLADVDGDGDQDVIVAGLSGVRVYENGGSFSFTEHIIDTQEAERVQVVDLNGDGNPDILATFKGSSPAVRWYRRESDEPDYSPHSLATAGADAVAYAGDIDQDGDKDIVTASVVGDRQVLERWMNNGDSTFTATTQDSDSKVTAITIGDLDRDQYPDIVTGGPSGLQRWDTSDGITWSRVDVDDTNANRTHLVLGDPGTGGTWIATADSNVDEVALYRSGSGDDSSRYGRKELATEVDAKTVAISDLDSDGDLDVLVAAQDDNAVYWYENDGSDMFTERTLATGLQSIYGVAAGDLDGDGDVDVVVGDHRQGIVVAYERLRAKPTATVPASIEQATNGSGIVTFKTTIADVDHDPTRVRVQYSVDGSHWYKPWLTKVVAGAGTIDVVNKNGYQVGTKNPIDTDAHDSVDLTLTWDTRSVENTGGPISGDVGTVRLRVIPRDDRSVGDAAATGTFRVDNGAATGFSPLRVTSTTEDSVTLTWPKPSDSSTYSYALYFGTDHAAVLEQRSDVWNADDDEALGDVETTSTTVTGLSEGSRYTFKLSVTDQFGNTAAAPSVRGTTDSIAQAQPTPSSTVPVSPSPLASAAPSPTVSTVPTPTSVVEASPSPLVVPSPSPVISVAGVPATDVRNAPPVADAGSDQVVNPRALVILDGTASVDADEEGPLTFAWRQLSGSPVDLLSDRTATASFSAGAEFETYIFALTVRDGKGASATDTVTIVTQRLSLGTPAPVAVVGSPGPTVGAVTQVEPWFVAMLLRPADFLLLLLSLLSTFFLLVDRLGQSWFGREKKGGVASRTAPAQEWQGRVLHYRTGAPVVGAQVFVYSQDGKLRTTARTNEQGAFPTFFPVGEYTLSIRAEGFTFAPTVSQSVVAPDTIIYTGGTLRVRDSSRPVSLVVPVKPAASEVGAWRVRMLHMWQALQRLGRFLSWPLFLAGALLNTVLVFIAPAGLYLGIEVLYVVLVMMKIALELRVRPAYGLVRDAITHIPLDLAVVRLFEMGTNRLVMTRVTNSQGRFFALPPAGEYTVTVSKQGYATFTKDNVKIASEQDATLQMTADLMAIATGQPVGGLQRARTATL